MKNSYFYKSDIIDCSIPCNFIFKTLSSCPTKIMDLKNLNSSDYYEIFMILLSSTAYPCCFFILLCGSYFKTTRLILIFIMQVLQNFLINILKDLIKDPIPNFKCNKEFGYPSNHSSFYTCLIIWFIIEEIFTERKKQFKYKILLVPLYIIYPFIVYSRYYLNYHSMKQVINGIIFGFLFSIFWYFFSVKYILKYDNPLKQIFNQLNVINTLTDDNISSFNFTDNNDNNIKNKELIQKYKELLENKDIEKIRNNLNKIAQNIKNDDFMKQQKKMMHLEDDDD